MNAHHASLAPGFVVDGFHVDQLLHEGGMARIYAVHRDPAEGALVMKLPRMEFGSHPACYVFFEAEGMILSALSGAHVTRLVAKGVAGENHYLVMERIAGPSLADAVRRAPCPPAEVACLIGAAALAVHAVHRQNVVHLDLKPEHILLREEGGEAVLIDFGLARHTQMPDLGGEEFAMPVGTGAYISPEQLAGIRSDPRSDIFALGVMAYQLATGKKPFGDPLSRSAMRRRLYLDPPPPRAIDAGLPGWLQEVILRCLEVRAEDRYATAAQLAHDLAFPDQIPLTARATRLRRRGWRSVLTRWLAARQARGEPTTPDRQLSRSPHLLVALDPDHVDESLARAMREAVIRALASEPGLRVTVMCVLRVELFGEDAAAEIAQAQHVDTLVAMRHWAAPLRLSALQLRFHVAEGTDPAVALLGYAQAHQVDRVVMGARGASRLRRFLGSVSSRVVAEAPCSVSVIRPSSR